MQKADWMESSEEELGSWAVFIGENGPTTPKITGRLYVTNRNVYFIAGLKLDANAGLMMAGGAFGYHADVKPPFQVMDERVQIARKRILRVTSSRQWLILNSLHLHLDDGTELTFRFGACSPAGVLAMLS